MVESWDKASTEMGQDFEKLMIQGILAVAKADKAEGKYRNWVRRPKPPLYGGRVHSVSPVFLTATQTPLPHVAPAGPYNGGFRCPCGKVRNTLRSLERHVKKENAKNASKRP